MKLIIFTIALALMFSKRVTGENKHSHQLSFDNELRKLKARSFKSILKRQPWSEDSLNGNRTNNIKMYDSNLDISKIINGYDAGKATAQIVAKVITYTKDRDSGVACSAVVISRDRILSAAHCFDDINGNLENIEEVFVVVGSQLNYGFKLSDKNTFRAYSVHVAIDYDPKFLHNDIAIVTINGYLPANRKFALLPKVDIKPNVNLYSAGYGDITSIWDSEPFSLQEVKMKFRKFSKCFQREKASNKLQLDWRSMICASGPNWIKGKKGVCYGDSGGPLFAKRKGEFILHGLASFKFGECVEPRKGTWFTKIKFFNNMIRQHISAGEDIEQVSEDDWYNIF